jgi:hypothetical protein
MQPPVSPMFATIAIPPGAVVVAPPPAMFGAACAAYLGMTPEQADRVLAEMARAKAFAACVVVLSKRPRALAAPPGDVLRYLRAERSVVAVVAANDADDGANDVLAELGLPRAA